MATSLTQQRTRRRSRCSARCSVRHVPHCECAHFSHWSASRPAVQGRASPGLISNRTAHAQWLPTAQAIWDLVKSLGAHLLRDGVNLTKVSLPVRVFEPRSFLERLTDSFAYLHLLEAAADAADPVARMQYLVRGPAAPNPLVLLRAMLPSGAMHASAGDVAAQAVA